MFADSRYADMEKKCRYADIADTDINIGTSLVTLHVMSFDKSGPKIDLKSIIKSETPPIIDSEFLDRFRALVSANQNSTCKR